MENLRFPEEIALKKSKRQVLQALTESANAHFDSKGPVPEKGKFVEDGQTMSDPHSKKSKNPSVECRIMSSRGSNEITGLNEHLGTELDNLHLPCRLDGDFQPVNRDTCSTIPLLIEYANQVGRTPNFIVAPLRLLVPFDYPNGSIHLSPVQPAGAMNQEINRELKARLDSDDPTLPGNVASIVELWFKLVNKASSAPVRHIGQ